ncbi:hypothetical protein [Mycobacterium persicum]|uniref:Transmembrane protein n=1 Tax=Mycobacterium persicum TaxID=1487726 RepID=A0A1X0LH42_9MYCO|nr:hypothetical protein [Mycobacterium persicum]KZS85081.1 hypothetical protein A4G31_25485 [Mycobacterium persicum]ORB51100.1 hypothetical protein BST40_10900 [Mycobacterium persicum]ORB92205.1 hypothetical protein B1T49_26440 [Mycobacterium persicum]ORB97593.1 hypothetical protein B1T44_27225 [Mycobacterium persicum]ORC09663.1 hypothetical protein B4U45_26740 [Mycobacterium persicum]
MVTTRAGRVKTWCSTAGWGSARWQRCLAALVTAVLFWPQSSVDADSGLDPSWEAAVALARIHHLAWGPEIVFTYGPLAFLQNTGYYSTQQAVLATLYQVAVIAALFLGVTAAMRRRYPAATALLGAFVTTGITAILLGSMYPEVVVLAAFAWSAPLLLDDDVKRSTTFITCVVVAAVGGFELLVKFNTGLVIAAIALTASILRDWRAVGRHCATVTTFAVSIPIWWLLAGQRLGNLPVWLRYSGQIVSGYIEGQAVPIPLDAVGAVLLTVAWLVVVCAMLVHGGRRIPRNYAVLVAVTSALIAKSSFGRYDTNHFAALLGLMVVTVAITPLYGILRPRFEIAVVLILVVFLAGTLVIEQRPVAVLQAPLRAMDRLATLAFPGRAAAHIQHSKARQRRHYGIPERFVETIGSAPVHVDPDEASVVWAYDFDWRPAPVFQTYSAYTPALDKLNSGTLADGPQFVVSRQSPTSPTTGINGRLGVQENPLYSRALLCDFAVRGAENHWELLARSQPRCGPLVSLSEVIVRDGNPVTVPAPTGPQMAVLVGIDLDRTIVDRLFMGSLIPLTTFTVVLDGASYRLTAGNAAEPFLVSTPGLVDATNLEIHSRTISVGRSRSLGQHSPTARLRFYEMRIGP